MVTSTATTVDEYIASLPDDRRAAVATVRDVVRSRLTRGSSRKTRAPTGA
jgi:hypothetical protein